MDQLLRKLLQVSLVLFMVGNLLDLGLRLDARVALAGLRNRRFVLLATAWGFVLCPAIAKLISLLVPMADAHALGLVLLGMTPGAPFLPLVVRRARGDPAYAAAFLLLASAGTVLYLPFAVPLLLPGFQAAAWTVAKPVLFFLLLPLGAGLAIRQLRERIASRMLPLVGGTATLFTLVLLVLCAVTYGAEFLRLVGSHAIFAQALLFSAMAVGTCWSARALPEEQRSVLTLGIVTRNLGAAFAPLLAVPGVERGALVMVAFGVLMQVAFALGAAAWFGRRARARGPETA